MGLEESSENVTADEEKRLGNRRSKQSSAFMVALKNKILAIDKREQDKYHKWFHFSSGRNKLNRYILCKHILYIMVKVFNVKESSYILQQIYLTKKEIKNMFNCCVSEKSKSNPMAPKAMFKITSTEVSLDVPQQKQVFLTKTLPRKPFLLEPQNDLYWMVNRSRAISKFHGCKESLDEVVMSRVEIDFF